MRRRAKPRARVSLYPVFDARHFFCPKTLCLGFDDGETVTRFFSATTTRLDYNETKECGSSRSQRRGVYLLVLLLLLFLLLLLDLDSSLLLLLLLLLRFPDEANPLTTRTQTQTHTTTPEDETEERD